MILYIILVLIVFKYLLKLMFMIKLFEEQNIAINNMN